MIAPHQGTDPIALDAPWAGAAGIGVDLPTAALAAELAARWWRSPVAATMRPDARVPLGALVETFDLTAWLGTPSLAPHCAVAADPLWPLAHRVGLRDRDAVAPTDERRSPSIRNASIETGSVETGFVVEASVGTGSVETGSVENGSVEEASVGSVSFGGAARLLRCGNRWVALSLARDTDAALLPAWLESELPSELRADDPDAVWRALAAALVTRDPSELRDRAALLGLPFCIVDEEPSTDPVLCEHVTGDRGAAARVRAPAPGPHRPGPDRRGPDSDALRGLTVVDLAALWAGPLCAAVLGQLGARVIKVESTGRPDGGRHDPAMFESLHAGNEFESVGLGSASGRARLATLLAAADVVIEGSRPRALEQLGIDARAVLARGRTRVWVSITAHGRSGVRARRVGFGDDAAAAGGLVGWVGGADLRRPVFFADAAADPLTGLTAAAAAVAVLAEPDAEAALLDVAMSRVAAAACARAGWSVLPATVRTDGRS